MKNSHEKLAREWFGRADEDWGVAHLLYGERDYPMASCFHAHQAAEKYLKGFLVFYGKDIEEEFKIHNLNKLFDYCWQANSDLSEESRGAARFLNKYYIATRYPGDIEEYSWEEVGQALEAIDLIKNEIFKICKI